MKKGIFYAVLAYFLWGFLVVYFKWLQAVPSMQIIGHRIAWSFLFLMAIIIIRGELKDFWKSLNRRTVGIFIISAILLTVNWSTYVWAITAGYVVEASLGYFINPLVSVVLGVFFIREKLRPLQWVPVGLAAVGVAYLTISYGRLPWISLVLAFTFGIYGLIKKTAPLNSLHGNALETMIMFLPAVGYLVYEQIQGVGAYVNYGLTTTLLLSLAGFVTAIPLLSFAEAARRIPLTTMGILQYLSPTMQFLLGVLVYHEVFDTSRLIGFGIIWLGLIIFSVEGWLASKKASQPAPVGADLGGQPPLS